MKKTLTVNLGGTVYHIDEDAYVLLDNYLNNLRYYFRREEGAEEIVRDIENRIGELFDEYLRNGQQVITVENVEAVIERMGKPEQLDEELRNRNLLPEPDVKKDLAVCSVIRTTGFWEVWLPDWLPISTGIPCGYVLLLFF